MRNGQENAMHLVTSDENHKPVSKPPAEALKNLS